MYLTYSQLGFSLSAIFIAGCGIGCLIAWSFQSAASLGDEDFPEPWAAGLVDHDGEQTYYPAKSSESARQ